MTSSNAKPCASSDGDCGSMAGCALRNCPPAASTTARIAYHNQLMRMATVLLCHTELNACVSAASTGRGRMEPTVKNANGSLQQSAGHSARNASLVKPIGVDLDCR